MKRFLAFWGTSYVNGPTESTVDFASPTSAPILATPPTKGSGSPLSLSTKRSNSTPATPSPASNKEGAMSEKPNFRREGSHLYQLQGNAYVHVYQDAHAKTLEQLIRSYLDNNEPEDD